MIKKEVYPWDSALLTVRGTEHRRVHLCVSEEEGCGKHFEDGRGLSTMPVRAGPELFGRKGTTTDHSAYQQEEAGEHPASFGASSGRLFQFDDDA